MSPGSPRVRHHVLGLVALALFAALFTRLWYLQVLAAPDYELAARSNRTRTVIQQAPRGRILDRNGEVLVRNRRTIQVTADYQAFHRLDAPDQSALLRRLAEELTRDQMRRFQGEVVADDPGPLRAAETPAGQAEQGESGEEGTGEGGTEGAPGAGTTTTGPSSTTARDGEDDTGAGPADAPPIVRPPPAGVATGAVNPDGSGEGERVPPRPATEQTLRDRLEDPRFSKLKPIPLATGVSEELEVYLRERSEDFPTVAVERVTVRDYRYGALLAHVLGYVGAVNDKDLEQYQNDEKPYENSDEIGKTGIERSMEEHLRGVPGRIVYEVDARNRPVREIASERRDPVPGHDVYLTVDIHLQYLAEKSLAAEIQRQRGQSSNGCPRKLCDPPAGAVVALDPANGQVLAMASYPTFDPNIFTGGISNRDFQAISAEDRQDEHHNPLTNRAIAGRYAPGSTFKLFSAQAALATDGDLTPEYQYNDTGVYLFDPNCTGPRPNNCSKANAGEQGHGLVNLARSLTRSSDTYYYRLAHRSWLNRDAIGDTALQDRYRAWGLGQPTGIDLPGEVSGRIPTPEWRQNYADQNYDTERERRDHGRWQAGDSANMIIGQGDVLATPLQLANGYATFANGGTVWRPQLVLQVTPLATAQVLRSFAAEAIGQVELPSEWRQPMVEGFAGVTRDGPLGRGTAATSFTDFDQSQCSVGGKTGTAQVGGKNDYSLFVAFAPVERASIAVAAIIEEGGFGSDVAVPLVRRILEPVANQGCAVSGLGAARSPYRAPLGGWFDVQQVIAETDVVIESVPD